MENGPLWTACRTNGYAYGVAFDFDYETNLVLLSISQCSQLKLAYSSAIETLKSLVEKKTTIDPQRIIAARNLTVCMLTDHLATLGRLTGVCIRSYLNAYSLEKYQDLLKEINAYDYNEKDLLNLIEKYLSPLINDNDSSTVILVNTNKMKETQEYLNKECGITKFQLIKDVVKHLCR